MYIWRDNSVRSHGSREAGESQALRGIIQFRDFPVQCSGRPRVSKDRGRAPLHASSPRKFIASPHLIFCPLSPFYLLLSCFPVFAPRLAGRKGAWAGVVERRRHTQVSVVAPQRLTSHAPARVALFARPSLSIRVPHVCPLTSYLSGVPQVSFAFPSKFHVVIFR